MSGIVRVSFLTVALLFSVNALAIERCNNIEVSLPDSFVGKWDASHIDWPSETIPLNFELSKDGIRGMELGTPSIDRVPAGTAESAKVCFKESLKEDGKYISYVLKAKFKIRYYGRITIVDRLMLRYVKAERRFEAQSVRSKTNNFLRTVTTWSGWMPILPPM